MASQIAKQITGMVNAAIVPSGVSSDGEKQSHRATKGTTTSPNPMRNPTMQQKIRRADPLHKYRVAVSPDGPAKKRTAAASRKEVLYPKSKQPIPDRSRLEDENEHTSSIAKKFQSRRYFGAAVKEMRHREDLWSAKDITNGKSQKPQAHGRAAKHTTSSKSHRPQADVREAQDVTRKTHHQFEANDEAAEDITDVKSPKSQTNMKAARDTSGSNTNQSRADSAATQEKINKTNCQHPQGDMCAATEITNNKSNHPQAHNWPGKDVTDGSSQPRLPPGPETNKKVVVPVIQKLAPYTVRRARTTKSPSRTLVAKPQLSNTSSKSLTPSFSIKQGSKGLHHTCMECRVATSSTAVARADARTSSPVIARADAPTSTVLPVDNPVLSTRATELVDVKVESAPGSPSSSATTTEIKMCNPCPSALRAAVPVEILVLSPRPKGPVHVTQVSATCAASPEINKSNPSPEELLDPAFEGFNILRSSILESTSCSGGTSPQVRTLVQDSHRQFLSNPPTSGLRHKVVMEATEIKRPKNPWQFINRSSSRKTVLFSNAAFAPTAPTGERPAAENQQPPVVFTPTKSPPKSPHRSTSATRRVMDRIGRAISAGRRSISPDITKRPSSTQQKLASLSPRKSPSSLISRFPWRRKRKPSTVTRASVIKSNSCARPSPQSRELPLHPGRKSHQREGVAALAKDRTAFNASGSLAAASTDSSSYFSLRMSEELNSNAQEFTFNPCLQGLQGDDTRHCSTGQQIATMSNANQLKWHTSLDWENEIGIIGVLMSCRRWVEESATALSAGYRIYEEENSEPAPHKISIKENEGTADWEDELVAPSILSTSSSKKVEDNNARHSAAAGCTNPGELKSSFSGVRRSFSTGRIRPGASFLKRARDMVRQKSYHHEFAFTNRSQLIAIS